MQIRVYKANKSKKKLFELLDEAGYFEIGFKNFNDLKVKLTMFIEKHPKELPDWVDEITDLFNLAKSEYTEELVQYNGAMIAETKTSIYMVPFGNGFWTLEKHADLDFGLDFAEKAIREENINLKGVSFIQSNKMRGVTNYKKGQNDFSQASESYFTVSGIPDYEIAYGKSIDCGIGVKFQKNFNVRAKNLETRKTNIQNLGQLFNEIDITMKKSKQSSIPRLQTLKKNDPKSQELDQNFLELVLNNNPTSDIANIDIDINRIQLIGDSIEIVDSSNLLEIYITGKKDNTLETININSEEIKSYLNEYKEKITSLERIQVRIIDSNSEIISSFSDLRKIMYCEFSVDTKVYIFQNGVWGYLNSKFEELLDRKMKEINKIVKFNEEFNIEYENVTEDEKEIGEGAYIETLCGSDKQMIKLHKRNVNVSGTPVEIADVYSQKRDELIAIKRGTETSLAIYSFEQSLLSIQALANQESLEVRKKLTDYNDNKTAGKHEYISKATMNKILNCRRNSVLWLVKEKPQYVFNGVNEKNFEVSRFYSILLKLKILNWYSFSKENGYEPTLYFAIDRPK